jgi:hypothetical protein
MCVLAVEGCLLMHVFFLLLEACRLPTVQYATFYVRMRNIVKQNPRLLLCQMVHFQVGMPLFALLRLKLMPFITDELNNLGTLVLSEPGTRWHSQPKRPMSFSHGCMTTTATFESP